MQFEFAFTAKHLFIANMLPFFAAAFSLWHSLPITCWSRRTTLVFFKLWVYVIPHLYLLELLLIKSPWASLPNVKPLKSTLTSVIFVFHLHKANHNEMDSYCCYLHPLNPFSLDLLWVSDAHHKWNSNSLTWSSLWSKLLTN